MKACSLAILFGIFAIAKTVEDSNSIFAYLATRSAYRFNANQNINDVSPEEGVVFFDKLEFSAALDSEQLESLQKWTPAVTDVAFKKLLTPEGRLENEEIAQRMQARFPTLFPPTFDNSTYWVC
ncbi:histidine phosphatase [Holotrichia oblita]|uniref:Histidine phosphatase n=1 Tax=Holotrichia oblita TaxID=644536 RepID=A0ACB9SMC5_HOLOL|nr:histidine phosphatase [Holotrichia oblita]